MNNKNIGNINPALSKPSYFYQFTFTGVEPTVQLHGFPTPLYSGRFTYSAI
jgi:hypothetical protein